VREDDLLSGPTERDIVLQARGIRKVFRSGEEELEVLAHVDLEVIQGESLAIMGASGVGKSTLLHIMGTLDRPTAGELAINAVDVLGLSDRELAHFRSRHIGFVFQFHHLLPEFSALENVLMPAMIASRSGSRFEADAIDLLRTVGLEKRLHHRPGELSGGECQRVALVRALAMRPRVVLADEPSGNLDAATSERLHALIGELSHDHGQTFVVMTHDQGFAAGMDRVGRLEEGVLRL
jgi:lipoprotein-releasing system ATP-binding protein